MVHFIPIASRIKFHQGLRGCLQLHQPQALAPLRIMHDGNAHIKTHSALNSINQKSRVGLGNNLKTFALLTSE